MPSEGNGDVGGPIFVLGAMGSGTTLLRLILDSHPNIAIPQETGFGRALQAQQYIPFWLFGKGWWGRLGYSDDQFRAHLREFYDSMFRHYAESHGKRRWGEKTPFHVWHVDRLLDVFPDAVFVGIVRHPGGNIGSLQGRFKHTIGRGMEHWSKANRELLAVAADHPDRVALCRYEDLVLDPETTMRELLTWLGEPWSPMVLEHHAVQSQRGTPQRVEGRTRSDDPIDVSRVSKWTERIDQGGIQRLSQLAPLARVFRYSVSEPVPAEVLGQGRLLNGAEAAARLADLRATAPALGRRPKPALRDRPLDPRRMGLSPDLGRRRRRRRERAARRAPTARAAQAMPAPRRPPGSRLGRVRKRLRRWLPSRTK